MIASDLTSFISSGLISGSGLAQANIIGFFAIDFIISLETTSLADKPKNTSAFLIASFKVLNLVFIANADLNQWGLSLYDVQSFTTLTLNQATSLSVPTFVKGQRSGATAFIRSAVSNSKTVTLYETQGEFVDNEPLFFDGILNGRISIAATSHGIGDVKSVFGTTDGTTALLYA